MGLGYSVEAFAGEIGVNIDSIYEWEKVHPAFSEAKSIAFGKNRVFWESRAIGDPSKVNASIWIFNMKNRFKWRDMHDITQVVESKGELNVTGLDLLSLAKAAKKDGL